MADSNMAEGIDRNAEGKQHYRDLLQSLLTKVQTEWSSRPPKR